MAANERQVNDQMRRAADFVFKHQRALQQALVGQALTLDRQVTELREIARTGEALSAQVATRNARRKEVEATVPGA